MTQLLQRLHDELVRRHYATTTRESYLRIVKAFHRRSGGRLDRVGPDDLRRYQIYLLEERKLAVTTENSIWWRCGWRRQCREIGEAAQCGKREPQSGRRPEDDGRAAAARFR